MDWIPRPANVVNPLPNVPCLSWDQDYDHGEWRTYPQKRGYHDRTAAQWAELFANPPDGFDAFIERWLFWAYLENIPGIGKLFVKDHTEYSAGRYCIRLKPVMLRMISAIEDGNVSGPIPIPDQDCEHAASSVLYSGTLFISEPPTTLWKISLFEFWYWHHNLFEDPRSTALRMTTEAVQNLLGTMVVLPALCEFTSQATFFGTTAVHTRQNVWL